MPTSVIMRALLVVCVLAVTAILLQPSAGIASRVVLETASFLDDLGVPATLSTPRRVEQILNAAMFVPPAVAAMIALPRLRWTDVAVAGFCGSLALELVQRLVLSARSAEATDVVANTTGALVGAVLGAVLRARLGRADHS